MSTSGGRALPVQHKYSIQLAHACPTMHHIYLVIHVWSKMQLHN